MNGRGCLAPIVAPHLHRVAFRMHASMGASLPASHDQRESGLVARVKNQGGSSSCNGHACSGATETAFALAGDSLGFTPSEIDGYRGGRSVERARRSPVDRDLPKLLDDGAMTEDVIAYMAAFGIRPRLIEQASDGRNSDVEIAFVNAELSLGELEADAQRLIVGPYAIDPTASDTERQVQAAIAANIPVRVDSYVDSVFENWTRGQAPAPAPNTSDPAGGGHAQYIVGYAPGFYIVRGSWGEGAGDGGDFLVSPEWVRTAWGLYPWTAKRAF